MSYLTKPFLGFIFALEPVWLPLLLLDVFAILILVFAERFNPRTLIFWISVVVIVPFAGFLLYVLFGSTLYSRWRFTNHKHAGDVGFLGGDGDAPADGDRSRAECLRALGADVYTTGNGVRFYWNGADMMADVIDDIRSARKSVHIMARRMPGDRGQVYSILAEKARDGVDVRLMTSVLGFGRTCGLRDLKRAGVRFCTFHNPVYSMFSVRPANRNYRALAVIDGNVAYQGRGAVLRVEGPAAGRLERRFRADWMYGADEDMGVPDEATARTSSGCGVQVVSDGPDHGESYPIFSCYNDLVSRSRKTLYMAFPYLLPNDDFYAAVKLAVVSGVDVRILLPRRGRHWYQSWNSLAASNPLMMAGAKVYFVDKMLGKCVIASDGEVCCVGSGDFSSRPLAQDFNLCCVVYSCDVSEGVAAEIVTEAESGAECLPEEYRQRSFSDVFKIGVARLMMFFN